MKTMRWLVGLVEMFALLQTMAPAADRTWSASVTNGDFTNAANWSGGITPGAGNSDTPYFNSTGNYNVIFTTDWTNNNLKLDKGMVTLNLNGHTYTVTNPPTTGPVIGGSPAAGLTITGGGTMIVTNGNLFYIGSLTTTGLVTVTGTGTVLDTSGVPVNGTVIRRYGDVRVDNNALWIANTPATANTIPTLVAGRVTVANGGRMTNAFITVGSTTAGFDGAGELWVTNGGYVHALGGVLGYFNVGAGYANAKMVIADPGSVVYFQGSYFLVASVSSNTDIIVTNGGLLWTRASQVSIGYSTTLKNTGTVVVAGNNAQWINTNVIANLGYNPGRTSIGNLTIGSGGVAVLKGLTCYSNSTATVASEGVLQLTNMYLYPTAVLQGNGLILGQWTVPESNFCLYNHGTVRPGFPTGTLSISNLQEQLYSDGRLLIQLGGREEGQYGRLSTAKGGWSGSTLYFGGTCEVACINGFQPRIGDTFNILDWTDLGTATNRFMAVVLPSLSGRSAFWVTNNLYTTGEISVGGWKGAIFTGH